MIKKLRADSPQLFLSVCRADIMDIFCIGNLRIGRSKTI